MAARLVRLVWNHVRPFPGYLERTDAAVTADWVIGFFTGAGFLFVVLLAFAWNEYNK